MRQIDAIEGTSGTNQKATDAPEIVPCRRKRGWISPRGKTPDHAFQAAIWRDGKKPANSLASMVTARRTVPRKDALRAPERN